MSIEIRNIQKSFGSFSALNDVSLDVPSGELVALLGHQVVVKPPYYALSQGLKRLIVAAFIFMD